MIFDGSLALAVGLVDCITIDRQRRLVDGFRQRRVSKYGHAKVLGAGAKLHGNGDLLH